MTKADMRVVVQGFEGCPNWRLAADRMREALRRLGLEDHLIELQTVTTPEGAAAVGFHGSPTILVDGADPFADDAPPVGFACRLYATESGPQGAPSIDQLLVALRR